MYLLKLVETKTDAEQLRKLLNTRLNHSWTKEDFQKWFPRINYSVFEPFIFWVEDTPVGWAFLIKRSDQTVLAEIEVGVNWSDEYYPMIVKAVKAISSMAKYKHMELLSRGDRVQELQDLGFVLREVPDLAMIKSISFDDDNQKYLEIEL